MPRFAGMLMAGLGMNIFGIVLSRAEVLYPRTLLVRAFFLVCIITFYAMSRDPFFLVLLAVVGFGFVWTGLSYLSEKIGGLKVSDHTMTAVGPSQAFLPALQIVRP